jgi:hypothetical protein
MKKIIIAIVVLISSYSFSQGNLQFNRVASDSFTTQTRQGTTEGDAVRTITVPSGKALKIVSFSVIGRQDTGQVYDNKYLQGNQTMYPQNYWATIGGHVVWKNQNANTQDIHFPIWLGEGNYYIILRTHDDTRPAIISYSALEFNIVQ